MVYRLQLTYDEIIDILVIKYVDGSTKGYTLPPGISEPKDIKLMLKSLLLNRVKVKITIDDIRLKSNLTTNKTIRFTKKSFFYTKLVFSESYSRVLGEIEGFIQLTPATYKSDKRLNITGIDKNQLKCINENIVNGIREPFLKSFGLTSLPVINYLKNLEQNFSKTKICSVAYKILSRKLHSQTS